ncbi:hypothetical protein H0194_04150 [Corynebacterium incognita]|uniref:Uncharacterized protein n=1 Tax=Corynebacterium incognita TaxID=2754725 RepID=A0A7G7CRG7_9CORY|nr:hypothetical protein [Corynebacterium incognita]QNE90183.1 hypothetical protein H0194_04150 [Corynebacterium incognita]
MDLSVIQLHLDNFKTTWEGWADVFFGLNSFFDGLAGNDETNGGVGKLVEAFAGSSK